MLLQVRDLFLMILSSFMSCCVGDVTWNVLWLFRFASYFGVLTWVGIGVGLDCFAFY